MTPLINYSHLSLGRSLSAIDDIVEAARKSGAPVVGLTDWHTVAGAPRFLAACEKAGIKGVVGTTINLRVDDKTKGTLVLLAKSDAGYHNILRILKVAGEAGEGLGLPLDHCVPADHVFKDGISFDDVFVLDGHKGSLSHALSGSTLHQGWFNTIARAVPEAQRLAVASASSQHPAIDRISLERRVITTVGMAVQRSHLPLAQAYFEDTYKSALPEDTNERLAYVRSLYQAQYQEAPPPKVESAFDVQAFTNSLTPLSVYHPQVQVKGISSQPRPDFHAMLDASWPSYSASLPPEKRSLYRERLEKERDAIVECGLVPYFENVMYFAEWEKSQGGFSMLRGSGVGSLVFQVLGITHVDPVEEGLMFERFVNKERNEEPDVDIEFSHYHSFYSRLDAHLPGQVAVINDAKGVKSSEVLLSLVDNAFSQYTSLSDNDKKRYQDTIAHLRQRVPTKRNGRAKPMAVWVQDIHRAVSSGMALSNEARHIIGACNVMLNGRRAYSMSNSTAILVPEGVDKWFSVYREKKGVEDVSKISLSKDDLAYTGFVKHDFLSNRFFSRAAHIARTLNVDINQPVDPDSPSIPRVFERGAYMGITQLSSTVGPKLADIMRPRNLSDMVALSALIRDGASEANMELARHFARSRENPDPALANSPLNQVLGETYGLLLYEEQLLTLLIEKGGFSFSEADKLRSGLKKGDSQYIDLYRDRFIDEAARQARAQGFSADEALKQAEFCYAPIENKRGRFVFSKAHALAYMVLGVKLCDMKCYTPALFFAEMYLDKSATHSFPEGPNGWLKSRSVTLYDVLAEWEKMGSGSSRHNARHLIVAIANTLSRENTTEHPDPDYRNNAPVVLQEVKEAIDSGSMDFIMPEGMTRLALIQLAEHRFKHIPSRQPERSVARRAHNGAKADRSKRNAATDASTLELKPMGEPLNGRRGRIDFDKEILPGALFEFLQKEGIIKGLQIERKSATQDSFRFRYTNRQGAECQRNFVGTGLRADAVAKQNPQWMTSVTEQGSRNAFFFLGLVGHLQNEIGFLGEHTVKMTPRHGLVKGEFVPLVTSFTRWLKGTKNKLYPMDTRSLTDYFEFDVATSPVIPAVSREDRRYAYSTMMSLLSESRAISPELLNEWLDKKQLIFIKSAMDSQAENPAKKITLDTPRNTRLKTNVLAVYRPVDPHTPLYDMPLVEGASLGHRGYQKFIKKMVDAPSGQQGKVVRANKIDFGKSTKRAPALFGGVVTKGAETLWVTEAIIDTYSFCDMQRLVADYNHRHRGDLPVAEENAVSIRSAGGGVKLLESILGIKGTITETGVTDARGIPQYRVDFCQAQQRRTVTPLSEEKKESGRSWLMERQFVWVGNPGSEEEQKQFKRLRAVLHGFGLTKDEIKVRIATVPVEGDTAQDRVRAYEYATQTCFKTQREQLLSADNLDTWLRGNDIDVIDSGNELMVGEVKEEYVKGPLFSSLSAEKKQSVAAALKERFVHMTGAHGIGVAVDPDKAGEQDSVFMRQVCHQIGVPVKSLRPIIYDALPAPLQGYVKGDALKDHNDYLMLIKGLQKSGNIGLADDMIKHYTLAFKPPVLGNGPAVPAVRGEDKVVPSPAKERKAV